ncbi:hypothetical protein BaRGS_00002482, partial [Batillaria attramentaria]
MTVVLCKSESTLGNRRQRKWKFVNDEKKAVLESDLSRQKGTEHSKLGSSVGLSPRPPLFDMLRKGFHVDASLSFQSTGAEALKGAAG